MSTENELPTIMSAKQVAAWLGLTEATVSRLLREGKLPGRYFGTRAGWRVLRADVETYFAEARGERRERSFASGATQEGKQPE